MIELLDTAAGDTTITELRSMCEKRAAGSPSENRTDGKPVPVVTERIEQEKKEVLRPFTLMAHKPNYLLVGSFNSAGYDSEEFGRPFVGSDQAADDTEAQFQVSIKFPLFLDVFDMFDIYGAYTNRSFWQVYNSDISEPIRATDHEPEIWLQAESGFSVFGFTNTVNGFGYIHQSNGRAEPTSRSWNRLFANFIFERDDCAVSIKPWYRLPERDDDDDNPDITDYLGHYEIRAAYKLNEHVFSVMSRNNLESGFSRGALEASWSFPLGDYPYLKGYIQYFTGYGESLIDYDRYVNRIGFGLALTDWL